MAKARLKLVYSREHLRSLPHHEVQRHPRHAALLAVGKAGGIFAAGVVVGALGFWAVCELIPALKAWVM